MGLRAAAATACAFGVTAGVASAAAMPTGLTYLSQFGSPGSGKGQFELPSSAAVDASHNVYVVDSGNNRVEKFSAAGGFLLAFGGAGTGNGQFDHPWGVAVDPGNGTTSPAAVYVADTYNDRVEKFTLSGKFIKAFGGPGAGSGEFNGAWGVAVDSGTHDVYVTDGNNRVQKFDSNGKYLAQFGSSGSNLGQFMDPLYIAVDATDHFVYVGDLGTRVQVFDDSGHFVNWFGGGGSGDGQFGSLTGLAVDKASGHVYAADSGASRVQEFDGTGSYLAQFGSSGAFNGELSQPSGVALDNTSHQLFVVDTNNNRVVRFAGSDDFVSHFGDTQLAFAIGVAVDSKHNVYVTDFHNDRVDEFTSAGVQSNSFGINGSGNGQFLGPVGVAFDAGNGATIPAGIYVVDSGNGRVEKFTTSGKFVWTSGGINGSVPLLHPWGIAVDPSTHDVYVVDRGDNRIVKLDPRGKYLAQFGNSLLSSPTWIAIDSSNHYVYAVEQNLGVIVQFDTNGNYLGQFGGAGSGIGQFSYAAGISVDPVSHDIYIVDGGNNRVQKFDTESTTHLYQSQFGALGSGPEQFNSPNGLALDPSANVVYVADTNNGRVDKLR
jgi:DNA-binding beta-propeller fold protein YncE